MIASLKPALDSLYVDFNHEGSAVDPIDIVRRYDRPEDVEIAGFLAAGLAFGRVAGVLRSTEAVLALMKPSPAKYVRRFDLPREAPRLKPFVHRWMRGEDIAALMLVLRHMLDTAGSLEKFFLSGYDENGADVAPALEAFSRAACEVDYRAAYGRARRTQRVGYFFPRPSSGSGCKRLNLFLRWMVRKDAVDLGVWQGVSPSKLVVPLDTHVIRVGQCLGLTRYRSPGWRMAAEITASLRRIDPDDPVKYDFSLCHLGMMDACSFNRDASRRECPLVPFCAARLRTPSPSRAPSARR